MLLSLLLFVVHFESTEAVIRDHYSFWLLVLLPVVIIYVLQVLTY